ncbi:MAG: hypothetical protein ACOYUK_01695 [Patescibacteria group bacterium]
MRVEQTKKEIPKAEDFKAPQPVHKLLVLFGLIIGATALFWLAWRYALTTIDFSLGAKNISTVIITLLAFTLMCALVALTGVLVTQRRYLLPACAIASATGVVFFGVSWWSVAAVVIMALGWMYWLREIRNDIKTRIKLIPQRTTSAGLTGVVVCMLLAISLMYYGFLVGQRDFQSNVTDGLVDTGVGVVNIVLGKVYGEQYNPDMTLDAFLGSVARLESLKQQGMDEVNALAPAEDIEALNDVIAQGISQAEQEIISQARQEFLDTFKIEAGGDEHMESVVKKIATQNITTYVDPYRRFIPALLAVSLFFLLNVFSILYRELIKSCAVILFYILSWTHFIKKTEVQTTVEKVTL